MKDSIAVVGDSETVLGFRLAGIQKAFTTNAAADDVDAVLETALFTPQVGILIVSQDAMEKASAKMRKTTEESTKPVVVVIPGKNTKSAKGSSNLAQLVKRAIGVDIMK
ncbi:V-type ATP synthase subunit F [Candidatus Micrarchaeota archaeon]|nr:V-type ATP synthase subunit F [Candidatus Micrarchaeota archaeon]